MYRGSTILLVGDVGKARVKTYTTHTHTHTHIHVGTCWYLSASEHSMSTSESAAEISAGAAQLAFMCVHFRVYACIIHVSIHAVVRRNMSAWASASDSFACASVRMHARVCVRARSMNQTSVHARGGFLLQVNSGIRHIHICIFTSQNTT